MPQTALFAFLALCCAPAFATSINTYTLTAYTLPIPDFASPGNYTGMDADLSVLILPDPDLERTIGADAEISYDIEVNPVLVGPSLEAIAQCSDPQSLGVETLCGFVDYQAYVNGSFVYSFDGNFPEDVGPRGGGSSVVAVTAADGLQIDLVPEETYYFPAETGSGGASGSITISLTVTGNSEVIPEPSTSLLAAVAMPLLAWKRTRRIRRRRSVTATI